MTTPSYTKSITYIPETRDFEMQLDGQIVGYAPSWVAAEEQLDGLVYNLLRLAAPELPDGPTPPQVAAACAQLAEEYRDTANGFASQGNHEAAKDLRSAARACDKAGFFALEGTQIARWVGDVLMVKSGSTGGVYYAVRRDGCCCKAADKHASCWHAALRMGHERAMEATEAGYALAA